MKYLSKKITGYGNHGLHITLKRSEGFKEGQTVKIILDEGELEERIKRISRKIAQEEIEKVRTY